MKNTKKRIFSLMLVLVLACSMLLAGCQKEPVVIKDSETCIVIKVTKEAMEGNADMLLIDYMNKLSEQGELACTISDGMITSINGIENPKDYSSCWMLYTSDVENSNNAWGTVEYDGVEYGSAISGAEVLKVKEDQLYIWVFQSFT